MVLQKGGKVGKSWRLGSQQLAEVEGRGGQSRGAVGHILESLGWQLGA